MSSGVPFGPGSNFQPSQSPQQTNPFFPNQYNPLKGGLAGSASQGTSGKGREVERLDPTSQGASKLAEKPENIVSWLGPGVGEMLNVIA